MRHYWHYFRGKVISCNAAIGEDGTDHFGDGLGRYKSGFFRYFQLNFQHLGIKKLITTHYVADGPSYKFEIVSNDSGEQVGIPDHVKTPLERNGDFRSRECLELLVVTDPPFSLMKGYLPLMVNSGKQFLILGNMDHAIISEIFHYFMADKVWLGYNSGHFWFRVPNHYEEKQTGFKKDETGQKWRRMGNICWFTNMDIEKRHQPLDLFVHYTSEKFPQYDQYNAINVDRTTDIPEDLDSIMGVPITFLDKHGPERFESLGVDRYIEDDPHYGHRFTIGGKETYARILIRRKQP